MLFVAETVANWKAIILADEESTAREHDFAPDILSVDTADYCSDD